MKWKEKKRIKNWGQETSMITVFAYPFVIVSPANVCAKGVLRTFCIPLFYWFSRPATVWSLWPLRLRRRGAFLFLLHNYNFLFFRAIPSCYSFFIILLYHYHSFGHMLIMEDAMCSLCAHVSNPMILRWCEVESTIHGRCDVELMRARRKPDDSSNFPEVGSAEGWGRWRGSLARLANAGLLYWFPEARVTL